MAPCSIKGAIYGSNSTQFLLANLRKAALKGDTRLRVSRCGMHVVCD